MLHEFQFQEIHINQYVPISARESNQDQDDGSRKLFDTPQHHSKKLEQEEPQHRYFQRSEVSYPPLFLLYNFITRFSYKRISIETEALIRF